MLGYPRPNMTCRQLVCVREMMNQYSGIVIRWMEEPDCDAHSGAEQGRRRQ